MPIPIIGGRQPKSLNEPAKVLGMTIIVVVQCQACLNGVDIALVNGQAAACQGCGTILSLDRVSWDRERQVPAIALSATPVRHIANG